MARILVLLVFVMLIVNGSRPHVIKKVSCGAHEEKRNEVINKSRCGEPKEVFVELMPEGSYLQVVPSSVWVKRCVGLCDDGPTGSKCIPIANTTRTEHIPVRILNLRTNRESCATYPVEVHKKCGCGCDSSTKECLPPRVFNPRKCNCQCPNMKERRNCLKQRSPGMRWNPSKCVCEKRRR